MPVSDAPDRGDFPVAGTENSPRSVARYVAIGDSQSEGLADEDGRGGYRGWADRFAELLTAESPHLQYANLAIRGRLLGAIRDEQLGPALDLEPDLVTVMGGLNDLIRPKVDIDALAAVLDDMFGAARSAGATVVTNTFPDPSSVVPMFRWLGPRVAAYNARIREAATRHGALLVDFAAHGVGTDRRIWSRDRIHATALGHSLIAAAFADTLGVAGQGHWRTPLPPEPRPALPRRIAGELRWLAGDVAPWIARRLRGRSTGDAITAKRPRLVPVAPLYHLVAPGDWPARGEYRPASLAAEGFVHLSFADQVEGPANRYYRDAAELVAVELDPMRIDAELRIEDSYGGGTAYPHAYGPLPAAAVVAVHPMTRGAEGQWRFSRRAGSAAAAASPGR